MSVKLVRDKEREEQNEFKRYGYSLVRIKTEPRTVMNWCYTHLASYSDDLRRDRWQYTIGLCQQVLAADGEGEEQ